MGWTERQRAMLEEIGVRVWAPAAALAPAAGTAVEAPPRRSAEAVVGPTAEVREPTAQRRPAIAIVDRSPPVPVVAAAGAVATMDWPQLASAVQACRACALCEERTQAVLGVGHPGAHWMIVGEAPGVQEDLRGEPFVGKSGQLLDNMLRALRLTRADADPAQQVYIANAVKCRPPNNRNPEPAELAQCEPFLVRQIELVRPRIILAMGRFAVQSLLRSSEPIGKLRGRVHRYRGVPLVVTYHPAYLLRNLEDKAKAWDDLCLALETAQLESVG
jgi:uracil-DNA glycosylase